MNRIAGTITDIDTEGNLSLVTAQTKAGRLTAIVIDTPETNPLLKPEKPVLLIFKETEVAVGIGNDFSISLQNQLSGKVLQLEKSALMSKVVIETAAGRVTAIITTRAVTQLGLKQGQEATALVKTNEIMLSE